MFFPHRGFVLFAVILFARLLHAGYFPTSRAAAPILLTILYRFLLPFGPFRPLAHRSFGNNNRDQCFTTCRSEINPNKKRPPLPIAFLFGCYWSLLSSYPPRRSWLAAQLFAFGFALLLFFPQILSLPLALVLKREPFATCDFIHRSK